ncbi:hypothetical protein [Streptomyces sp. NRRL S-244]|uniref:hypothetical protein n=1 Tax=Streptomyces sp. NRRL S-244 TaxID=1463897 RepID=UPI0004C102C4|nr:hypothetical protein [Streptomyces sp. NRRL S-244]
MSSAQVSAELALSKATVDVQISDRNAKTGVTTRTTLVHTTYVTGQPPRPELITPALVADEVEREILWRPALSAELAKTGRRCHYSANAVGKRLRALRKQWNASNNPHLVTLAWQYGVLDDSRGPAGFAARSPTRR